MTQWRSDYLERGGNNPNVLRQLAALESQLSQLRLEQPQLQPRQDSAGRGNGFPTTFEQQMRTTMQREMSHLVWLVHPLGLAFEACPLLESDYEINSCRQGIERERPE